MALGNDSFVELLIGRNRYTTTDSKTNGGGIRRLHRVGIDIADKQLEVRGRDDVM